MSSLLSDQPPARILMYHLCHKNADDPYADMRSQLRFIEENNYETVHLSDIANYLQDPDMYSNEYSNRKVVLTFDDAYMEFYKKVWPLLKGSFKATICVPTGYIAIDEENRQNATWENGPKQPLMIWKELRQLAKESSIEIIPHSVWHIGFEQFDNDERRLRYEICCSRLTLEHQLGLRNIQFFCFPGGAGVKFKNNKSDPDPLLHRILQQEGFVGALKAEYGYREEGRRWNQYCIPRCQPDDRLALEKLLTKEGGFECR